jgi:Fe-S oxidoreductase
VRFVDFILRLRSLLADVKGLKGYRAHDGAVHSWMRIMTAPELKQNRLEWLTPELKVAQEGPVAFFVGCAPYFDVFFSSIGVDTLAFARDGLKLMNRLGITPVVLGQERCCGHDLLWSGDQEHFGEVARLNVERLNSLGITTMITTCPECYITFKTTYPNQGLRLGFEVVHLYDFLEQQIDRGAVEFSALDKAITFQDSCRLCRLEGRAELPRQLLTRLQPTSFSEMRESGNAAMCCGNTAWMGCDAYSKAMQVKRLQQARETGAELLVTSCPKCQIHLQCAMQDPFRGDELQIEMQDLTSVIAETIRWKE